MVWCLTEGIMSKNKKNTMSEEKPKTDPGASLPEDKPDNVDMSPAVKDVESKNDVLKRGVAMERVESPRYGVPGQATAMRAVAGGGAFNPSAQVGRTPSNPEQRGAGSDPLNKMDIRDELAWNDIGAEQLRTIIEGSPAGFAPDAVLGNYTFEDNLVFQFDNAGHAPGEINRPYRRRVQSVSKDQLVFITGQHDTAAKSAMRFYPSQTYERDAVRQVVSPTDGVERGNYLTRGMYVDIAYVPQDHKYVINHVRFDTDEINATSSANDLDVRQDNARVIWDIADRDITETYFGLVNKQENLQANKYSPLPDGQPDAIQHLILSRDVACADGAIAFAAIRSALETYAYNRFMRHQYGAGEGARAQTRNMLGERVAQSDSVPYQFWADNENMIGNNIAAGTVGDFSSDWFKLTMDAYIQAFLDSPTKYNSNYGVWVTQPRGLRLLFEEAQRSFDTCDLHIDKDTYTIIDQCLGWHKFDNKLVGIGRMGLVLPFDLNKLYEHDGAGVQVDNMGEIHSQYTYVDYVLNGSMYNLTEVRSPLIDAILQVFKYRVIPKLKRTGTSEAPATYSFYVPFDFACDHFSFGHAVIMEALPYMHQYLHTAHAIFERFAEQYGTNPVVSDLMQELKLADVMRGSSYKGIGADPVFPDMGQALQLILELPETYQVAAMTWDRITELPDALFAVKFSDLAPISDSIEQPSRLLFPMMYKTMVLPQWQHIRDVGPEKLLRSRDFPIHRYTMVGAGFNRNDAFADTGYNTTIPFFDKQTPQVYHTENIRGSYLHLTVGQVLRAPRYSGRIAPAPAGLLDFVRVGSGVTLTVGKTVTVENNNRPGTTSGTTTTYAWMGALGDDIISFRYNNHNMEYNGYEIENYRVDFVYMPAFEMTALGSLLHRYCVHFSSGAMPQYFLEALSDGYGIWVGADQQSVNVVDCTARVAEDAEEITIPALAGVTPGSVEISARYQTITIEGHVYDLDPEGDDYVGDSISTLAVTATGTIVSRKWTIKNSASVAVTGTVMGSAVSVSMLYENDAMKMWTSDNIFPFVFSPFTGNAHAVLSNNSGKYEEVNHDITMATMFGLAGYQALWYDRLNNDVYAKKQAVGGRIYDNDLLHQSNIFFS